MKKEYFIIMFVIIAAFTATAAFFYPSLSTDAWWHISSGREIIKAKGLPAQDDFYCNGNNKWYAHEWAFDSGIFLLYSKGGERAVKSSFTFIFFIVLLIILFTAKNTARGDITAAIPAALLACAMLIPYTEERPQMITAAAMAVYMFACSFKPDKTNIIYFYFLVPLTILWTNFHSAAIAGVYVFIVYFIYYIVTAQKADKKFIITHSFIITVLLFGSTLLSPLGLQAIMFFGENAWLKQYINEWQGLISKGGTGYIIYTAVVIAAGITGMLMSVVKITDNKTRPGGIRDLFILIPFFLAVFVTKKILPLFIIALVPVIAAGFPVKGRKLLSVLASLACLIFIFLFLTDREIVRYPKAAMEYIKSSGGSGCVLTSFEWGGYAENELYPGYKVFLNGRLNVSQDVIRKYSNIYNAEGDFKEFMKEIGADYYVLRQDSPLSYYFFNRNIQPVYKDGICSVFSGPQVESINTAKFHSRQ